MLVLVLSVIVDEGNVFFFFLVAVKFWMFGLWSLELGWLFEVFKICNFTFLFFEFAFKILVNTTSLKHLSRYLISLILQLILNLLLFLLHLLLLKHFDLSLMHGNHVGFGWADRVICFFNLVESLLHLKCFVTFVVSGGVVLNCALKAEGLHLRKGQMQIRIAHWRYWIYASWWQQFL